MISLELREIFEPAYDPCIHFRGVCSSVCVWQPEGGYVPRGFGGAAWPDRVSLVIVTAEPGNPGYDEKYYGSADNILSEVLGNRRKHLTEGVIRRGADPYNPSLRKILQLCWPKLSIEQSLERTWITNSVKCSAQVSGGEVPRVIERTCINEYLRKELALFSNAFVLALGKNKVVRRLERSGISFDAGAQHPSARKVTNPEETWKSAAEEFRRWLREREFS
jgi:hypothetical protein